jgi:hypothetical protein
MKAQPGQIVYVPSNDGLDGINPLIQALCKCLVELDTKQTYKELAERARTFEFDGDNGEESEDMLFDLFMALEDFSPAEHTVCYIIGKGYGFFPTAVLNSEIIASLS